MEMLGRVKTCEHFPCHEDLEDCTFCYCPFYPCIDGGKGRFVSSSIASGQRWDCSGCGWIHRRETVRRIYLYIRENRKDFF